MDYVGMISAAIAVIAAYIAYHSVKEQRQIFKWSINYTRLADTEAMANNCASILELHGVTEKDLKNVMRKSKRSFICSRAFWQARSGQEYQEVIILINCHLTESRC